MTPMRERYWKVVAIPWGSDPLKTLDRHLFAGCKATIDWLDVVKSSAPPQSAKKREENDVFHVLACFNLRPECFMEDFRISIGQLTRYRRDTDLVDATGPVGRRQRDTIMNTFSSCHFVTAYSVMMPLITCFPTTNRLNPFIVRCTPWSRTKYSSAGKTCRKFSSPKNASGFLLRLQSGMCQKVSIKAFSVF